MPPSKNCIYALESDIHGNIKAEVSYIMVSSVGVEVAGSALLKGHP